LLQFQTKLKNADSLCDVPYGSRTIQIRPLSADCHYGVYGNKAGNFNAQATLGYVKAPAHDMIFPAWPDPR
jgi:hypothetical protein